MNGGFEIGAVAYLCKNDLPMRLYPTSIADFRNLREEGNVYVDKTKIVHDLITSGVYYFLSRPRRFGKSMLISTLKEAFSGDKELFKGLWIEDKIEKIGVSPVIHISFSRMGFRQIGLEKSLEEEMDYQSEKHQVSLERQGFGGRFFELIEKLSKQAGKVVVLIDEYDKPIIEYLDDLPQAEKNRDMLRGFYGILKDADPFLRFVFITGVSKFSRVSIFSEMNNLDDITFAGRFAEVCGITQRELEATFPAEVKELAEKESMTVPDMLAKIRLWYNGYSWGQAEKLYNPFGLMRLMKYQEFQNYWFASGTPTFLVKVLNRNFDYNFEETEADNAVFEAYNFENLHPVALLFQTGYLTIKEKTDIGSYMLTYPNKEVRDALQKYLLAGYLHVDASMTTPLVAQIFRAMRGRDVEKIVSIIHSLFKAIPGDIFIKNVEKYYHSIMYLTFNLLGQFIQSEVRTSDGRIDAVAQTASDVFIFEFKLDKTPEIALQQILDKDYAAPYLHAGKGIFLIGVNFSSKEKGVDGWVVKELKG